MDDKTQDHATGQAARRRLGFLRFSSVEMLISLVLLFIALPFIDVLPNGKLIEAILMTLFFFSAVLAVGGGRGMLLLSALLALPAVVGRWMHHLRPDWFPPSVYFVCTILFLAFVIVHILRFVLKAPRVNGEVLCASISAYLSLGLLWTLAYRLLAAVSPSAFVFNVPAEINQPMDGFTAFYFSYTTLTTLGYGDITPVSRVARMLAVMESMTGTLYVAVLIARLVALYSSPVTSNPEHRSDPPRP